MKEKDFLDYEQLRQDKRQLQQEFEYISKSLKTYVLGDDLNRVMTITNEAIGRSIYSLSQTEAYEFEGLRLAFFYNVTQARLSLIAKLEKQMEAI